MIGLSSRFPNEIQFDDLMSEQCLAVLRQHIKEDYPFTLSKESVAFSEIEKLKALSGWGNGRDMKEIGNLLMSEMKAVTPLSRPHTSLPLL